MAFCLSKRWRAFGLKFIWYVDDIIIFCKHKEAKMIAEFVERELEDHGLLRNPSKSYSEPRNRITGLGIDIWLDKMVFRVPEDKKQKIVKECSELLAEAAAGEQVQLRRVASVVGKIMATHIAIGDTARLFTRKSYHWVAELTGVPPDSPARVLKVAWNQWGSLPVGVCEELQFFVELLPSHEGSEILPSPATARLVIGSDTSDAASGGFLDAGKGKRLIARRELKAEDRERSSTSRELTGAEHNIEAFERQANAEMREATSRMMQKGGTDSTRHLLLFLDSRSAVRALTIGSKNPALHRQAMRIHAIAMRNSWNLLVRWQRRSSRDLSLSDDVGKIDDCDFQLSPGRLQEIEEMWKINHNVDCFASSGNALRPRFYSRFWCKGTAAVDAFSVDWSLAWPELRQQQADKRPQCWLHPPQCNIAQTVRHLQRCGGRGTILVPLDRSAIWWPLVAPGARGSVRKGSRWQRHLFTKGPGLLRVGGKPQQRCRNHLVAVSLDFANCDISIPERGSRWLSEVG
jgi:hypothetical protein